MSDSSSLNEREMDKEKSLASAFFGEQKEQTNLVLFNFALCLVLDETRLTPRKLSRKIKNKTGIKVPKRLIIDYAKDKHVYNVEHSNLIWKVIKPYYCRLAPRVEVE